jgi:E3 ubiquitin-protein ligase HECTD1
MCEELGKVAKEAEAALRRQRRLLKNNMVRHMLTGAKVVRGEMFFSTIVSQKAS